MKSALYVEKPLSIARSIKHWLQVAILLTAAVAIAVLVVRCNKPEPETSSQLSDEIVVMRTNGGWLEVSTVNAVESFDKSFDHEILWIPLGTTVSRIRVPAHYKYRARLAAEWKILRRGNEFVVIAPNVEPSLPVAVDLDKMEKQTSGIWSLFTGTDALDDLERSIAAKLARKARSPLYINIQREAARKTVAEFVRKWLLTQAQFKDLEGLRMRVLFKDEPLESLGPMSSQLFDSP